MMTFDGLEILPIGEDTTAYRLLDTSLVSTQTAFQKEFTIIQPEALRLLTQSAMVDINHFFRASHLKQLQNILNDPEASKNDRFVALELLKNANISAGRMLPSCQDTGTAIIIGKKGQHVFIPHEKEQALIAQGVFDAYQQSSFRYSQLSALSMYQEVNTKNNLPAQIELYAESGNEYHFLFIAKGGGSANKTFLYQQTKAILQPQALLNFFETHIRSLGTSACPPYHLAIVIGGLSAEYTLKVAKLASTRYLDSLPTQGSSKGQAFRDLALEASILSLCQKTNIGAQFGGKYFCHDVRVIRLPRHSASCPIGIAVSCSADRQAKGKITPKGIFLEQLEMNPAQYLPALEEKLDSTLSVSIDLNQPISKICQQLSQYPIRTRLCLSGSMIVARDSAHARWKERLDSHQSLPEYTKQYLIYYAGPAKTPQGFASGAFGPTTAGRMDSYIEPLQQQGASLITLAKGNRSKAVKQSCQKYGGFYLGSIGGAAAALAQNSIKKIEVLDFPELDMEAVWKIEVENFPCFIVVDDKGNDFFESIIE